MEIKKAKKLAEYIKLLDIWQRYLKKIIEYDDLKVIPGNSTSSHTLYRKYPEDAIVFDAVTTHAEHEIARLKKKVKEA